MNLLRGPAEPSHSHPLISLSPLFQLSAAGTPGLSPLSLFLLLYTKKTMKSQVCTTRWQKVLPFRLAEAVRLLKIRQFWQKVEVQLWTPVQRKRVLKRGQKVDPLEIKSGPPWRVQFWPLHCGKYVEAFISS